MAYRFQLFLFLIHPPTPSNQVSLKQTITLSDLFIVQPTKRSITEKKVMAPNGKFHYTLAVSSSLTWEMRHCFFSDLG